MATITDTWDSGFEASPADSDNIADGDDSIRQLKRAISERGRREHYWTPGADNTLHGKHLLGSARIFYGTTEPTTAPDGDALGTNDMGRMWYNSSNAILYGYGGSSWGILAKEAADYESSPFITEDDVYTRYAPLVPTTGDKALVRAIAQDLDDDRYFWDVIERVDATTLKLVGVKILDSTGEGEYNETSVVEGSSTEVTGGSGSSMFMVW